MQTTKAKLDAAMSISAKENSRYALRGVRVTSDRINPDDPSEYKFLNRIEATNAKILIRIDEISSSNGIPTEGLILTKDAIKSIPKGKRDSVDILIEGDVPTALSCAGTSKVLLETEDGRWPGTNDVFPEGPAEMEVVIPAKQMIQLLKSFCSAVQTFDGHVAVKMKLYGPNRAIVLEREVPSDNSRISGVIMPLTTE